MYTISLPSCVKAGADWRSLDCRSCFAPEPSAFMVHRLRRPEALPMYAMWLPSGERVAPPVRVVCSRSATLTGAAPAWVAETTLLGSVGTRSPGPEAIAVAEHAASRRERAFERSIGPRGRRLVSEAIYLVTTRYTNASDVFPPGELSTATR